MKGLYFWIGFRQAQIPYEPEPRNEGASGWSLTKLLGLALNGITAFSTIPLRLAAFLGLVVSLVALIYAVVLVTNVIVHGVDVPGFASLMVGLLFLSGVQLISLGILGEYIGRVFNESKQRPLYLIEEFRRPEAERADPGRLPRLAGE
jgi:polyisoprenyl-phosphate glycosyltransferase